MRRIRAATWAYDKVSAPDISQYLWRGVMPVSTTRTVAIKLDQDTQDRVKRLADSRQRTPDWMMKEAINQYLEREEKREVFRQDAVNTWDEYKTTGMHVSADEVTAWLETWGEENEQAAPICHK